VNTSADVTLSYTAATFTGSVSVGNISMVGTNAHGIFDMQFNNDALGANNAVTVGTISFDGTTAATLAVTLGFDAANVSVGGITVEGTGAFGADYLLTVNGHNIAI